MSSIRSAELTRRAAPLREILRRAALRHALVESLRSAATAFFRWLLLLLALLLLDAAVALPASVRLASLIALPVILVVMLLGAIIRSSRELPPEEIARQAERLLRLRDNRYQATLDLAASPSQGASPALVSMAVDRGARAASDIKPSRVVPGRSARRAVAALALLVVVASLLHVLYPRLLVAVVPRLVDPNGDHPPFTFVVFQTHADPNPIYYGDPATVSTTLGGLWAPSEAHLVLLDERGEDPERFPMTALDAEHVFELRLPDVRSTRRFYIDTPRGRSRTATLKVLPAPSVEWAEVLLTPPPYTGWSARREQLSPGGVTALAGTTAEFSVYTNLPLDRAELTFVTEDGERRVESFAASAERPTEVVCRTRFDRSGYYEIALIGADGSPGRSTLTAPVRVTPDHEPRVWLDAPERLTLAPEGAVLEIKALASDDVAVARLAVHAGVSEVRETPLLQEEGRGRQRRLAVVSTLELSELGAADGDIVRVYASAFDSSPDAGLGVSETHEIHVVSREGYEQLARRIMTAERMDELLAGAVEAIERLRAEREALGAEAQEILDRAEGNGGVTEQDQERLNELSEALARNARETSELAEAMRGLSDHEALDEADQSTLRRLGEIAEQLDRAAEAAAEAGQAAAAGDASELRQALDAMDALDASAQATAEKTAQELREMREAAEVMTGAAAIMRIADMQQDLADRVAEFAAKDPLDADDLKRLRRFAVEQHELRRMLERSLEALELGAEAINATQPELSAKATALAERVRALDPMANQRDAAEAGESGSGDESARQTRIAADKLDSLRSECQGVCNGGGLNANPGLGMSPSQMASALEQMSQSLLPGLLGQGTGASIGGEGPGAMAGGLSGGASSYPYKLAGPIRSRIAELAGLRAQITRTIGNGKDASLPGAQPPRAAATGDAETLDPGVVEQLLRQGGALGEVPAEYRALAARYFESLREPAND